MGRRQPLNFPLLARVPRPNDSISINDLLSNKPHKEANWSREYRINGFMYTKWRALMPQKLIRC